MCKIEIGTQRNNVILRKKVHWTRIEIFYNRYIIILYRTSIKIIFFIRNLNHYFLEKYCSLFIEDRTLGNSFFIFYRSYPFGVVPSPSKNEIPFSSAKKKVGFHFPPHYFRLNVCLFSYILVSDYLY